jgi:hypothetical protein
VDAFGAKGENMGIVYILTNDAMPGIIKIGITESTIEDRIKSLDNTSLPLPFRFYFAIETKRFKEIEKLAHNAFSDHRIRDNREFFRIDPERAVAALRIAGDKELKQKNEMIDETGTVLEENIQKNKERKKRFSFDLVNIEIGSELTFTRDDSKKCKVFSNTEVEYDGKVYSLSGLADKLLTEMGYNWKSVQGPLYFEYNGKTLSELRNENEDISEYSEVN